MLTVARCKSLRIEIRLLFAFMVHRLVGLRRGLVRDMMKGIAQLVAVVLGFVAIEAASQGLPQRPINLMAAETFLKLQQRDFTALERLAESLRQKNVPLEDGQPMLAAFYAGVSKCEHSPCGDERLSAEDWVAHGRLLDDWIRAFPKSTTARLAKAVYTKEYAWYARGGGYANTVPMAQWKIFNDRIQQAHSMLRALGSEAENDPHWYATVLSIALVQSWPKSEFEKIFLAGTRKFPYYLPIYFTKGEFVSAKWGGSQADFDQFVEETVQSTRNALGETMYTRLHWSSWSRDMFRTGRTDWHRMKNGFMRMTRDYPHPWNVNNFAKFACMARDVSTLAEQLAKIGDPVILDVWGNAKFFAACKEFSATATRFRAD